MWNLFSQMRSRRDPEEIGISSESSGFFRRGCLIHLANASSSTPDYKTHLSTLVERKLLEMRPSNFLKIPAYSPVSHGCAVLLLHVLSRCAGEDGRT